MALDSIPDSYSSYIVSRLLSIQTGQPVSYGLPQQVCEDVRAVGQSRAVVVLTDLDPAVLRPLMRRGGCEGVEVVRLRGGSPDGARLMGSVLSSQTSPG